LGDFTPIRTIDRDREGLDDKAQTKRNLTFTPVETLPFPSLQCHTVYYGIYVAISGVGLEAFEWMQERSERKFRGETFYPMNFHIAIISLILQIYAHLSFTRSLTHSLHGAESFIRS